MAEDDGGQVSTVVVSDQVFGGVGDLEDAGPQRLLVEQRLVQSKDHLQTARVHVITHRTC